MESKIRLATREDTELLIELRFAYFSAEGKNLDEELRRRIRSQLQVYFPQHLNLDCYAALAEVEGQAASVALMVMQERPAGVSFPTGKVAGIYNVFTYPEFRRMGLALRALERLIDLAGEEGASLLQLSATDMGLPLYEKLGFHPSGKAGLTEMERVLLQGVGA